ncbi:DMT family transporter [Micrococcus luteus]
MRAQSSATTTSPIAVATPGPERPGFGTLQAALGVVAFSLTFPATAWGLEGFGPWSLVAVRSVLAAVIAGGCLLALRVPLPARRHWAGLAVVGAGVVLGFPLLTTLALETSTTAHAAVVVGLLPLTAQHRDGLPARQRHPSHPGSLPSGCPEVGRGLRSSKGRRVLDRCRLIGGWRVPRCRVSSWSSAPPVPCGVPGCSRAVSGAGGLDSTTTAEQKAEVIG